MARGRDELESTMIGVVPHSGAADDEGDVPLKTAAIDPSAEIDLQTGAIITKKTSEERRFVARLDAILLVYTCVSQVLKYLDQQKCVRPIKGPWIALTPGQYLQRLCLWHEGGLAPVWQ